MTKALLLASLFPLCAPFLADAATCTAASSAKLVPIVELYTSEGCDSCPPADKWFSTLKPASSGVIPLAFHVDYWDYIGWKDEFGQAAFGERQRAGVRRQGGRVAYTPQVVLDGQDLRGWFRQTVLEASLTKARARQPRARIEVGVVSANSSLILSATGDLTAGADGQNARLFVAITENNLTSRITAGENRGVTLKHDHAVRNLIGPLGPDAQGRFNLQRNVPLPANWKLKDLGAVAFVQDQGTGETLQAVALALCGG